MVPFLGCEPGQEHECCAASIGVVHKIEEPQDREGDRYGGGGVSVPAHHVWVQLFEQARHSEEDDAGVEQVGEAQKVSRAHGALEHEKQVADDITIELWSRRSTSNFSIKEIVHSSNL